MCAMITLPAPSLVAVATLPLEKDLRQLPDNFILRLIVALAGEYPSLVPDLNKPKNWTAFKAKIGERSDALKITEFYIQLYENDDYLVRLLFQFSFIDEYRERLADLAGEAGFGDFVHREVHEADPERLRAFIQVIGAHVEKFCQSIDEIEDWSAIEAEEADYWQRVHPTLPEEERLRVERDTQIYLSVFFYALHNAISVMAYGEQLNSLVQRALFASSADERDRAMCMSVRIDNNLRNHPMFKERYLLATREGDASFLREYDNTAPPLAGRVRYRALYFLLAMLDCYGLLSSLTDRQLLDLCDQAKLDRWGNRIEDEGYLGKRRREYQRHKFTQMSRHSM